MQIVENLRKNYGLTRWLIWISFIATYTFSTWFEATGIVNLLSKGGAIAVSSSFWVVLLTSMLASVIMLLLINVLVGVFLNIARIYYLPRNEFILFFVAFMAVKSLVLGLLNLTYLITPVISVWGSVLFPLIAYLSIAPFFYKFVSKQYLNAKTAPHFFKCGLIVLCVACGISVLSMLSLGSIAL